MSLIKISTADWGSAPITAELWMSDFFKKWKGTPEIQGCRVLNMGIDIEQLVYEFLDSALAMPRPQEGFRFSHIVELWRYLEKRYGLVSVHEAIEEEKDSIQPGDILIGQCGIVIAGLRPYTGFSCGTGGVVWTDLKYGKYASLVLRCPDKEKWGA